MSNRNRVFKDSDFSILTSPKAGEEIYVQLVFTSENSVPFGYWLPFEPKYCPQGKSPKES